MASGSSDPQQRTAAGLTPLIRDVLARGGARLPQVSLIALPVGPGSFTGLRVGVTTAKTLAYALPCEVLGLDTLEVIAKQTPAGPTSLWVAIDAQRQQLLVRRFERTAAGWSRRGEAEIVDNEAFVNRLTPDDVVTGPGLKRIAAELPSHATVVDERCWHPQAETVGRLAMRKYEAGERGDLWQLVPQYFRPSAAEEKRAQAK